MIAILANDPFSAGYFVGRAVMVLFSLAVVIWWIVHSLFFKNSVRSTYLWKDGQQHGPYPIGAIRGWLAAGQLQATDRAWFAAKWTPLSFVPGIGVPVKRTGPPTWLLIVALLGLFGTISSCVSSLSSIAANPPVDNKAVAPEAR
jgi:GYF domain 2